VAEEAAADLGTRGSRWSTFAPAEWLKAAVSATTALGIVTYAVLRVDYALFYDRFGLKPEDVGLGQAELISQSLSGVVLMLVLFFVLLVFLFVMMRILGALVRELIRTVRDVQRRDGILAAIFLVVGVAGAIFGRPIGATAAGPWLLLAVAPAALWLLWRSSRQDRPSSTLAIGGFSLLVCALSLALGVSARWTVVGFVGLFVLAAITQRWSSQHRPPSVPPPRRAATVPATGTPDVDEAAPPDTPDESPPWSATTRRVVVVLAVVLTVALTETLLALSAVSDADYVRTGHAVQPTMLGIPLVSWGARGVDVAWDSEPPPGEAALVDHCFLYLGQGGGSVLLYDHDSGRTIRIPSGAVVLSIQARADYQRVCPR
jgi:hypothetical protein